MKTTLQILSYLFLIASTSLMAQSVINSPSNPLTNSSAVRHVGSTNAFKIGTPDNPVCAAEYCAFLQTIAAYESTWFSSSYYDSSFMNVAGGSSITRTSSNNCIQESRKYAYYKYSVLSGDENDIIDALQSKVVQDKFNAWRQNPTVPELADYMNESIAGDKDAANTLRAKYQNSLTADHVFHQQDCCINNYLIYHNLFEQGVFYQYEDKIHFNCYEPTLLEKYHHYLPLETAPSAVFFKDAGITATAYANQDKKLTASDSLVKQPSGNQIFKLFLVAHYELDELMRPIIMGTTKNADAPSTTVMTVSTETESFIKYIRPSSLEIPDDFSENQSVYDSEDFFLSADSNLSK